MHSQCSTREEHAAGSSITPGVFAPLPPNITSSGHGGRNEQPPPNSRDIVPQHHTLASSMGAHRQPHTSAAPFCPHCLGPWCAPTRQQPPQEGGDPQRWVKGRKHQRTSRTRSSPHNTCTGTARHLLSSVCGGGCTPTPPIPCTVTAAG